MDEDSRHRTQRVRAAIARRNVLTHGSLEVRNAGDYETESGQLAWSEGEVFLERSKVWRRRSGDRPRQRTPGDRRCDSAP